MRPGDEVQMKRLEGSVIPRLAEGEIDEDVTSKEWIRDKAMAGRVGAAMEEEKYKKRITNRAELGLAVGEGST
jgi:hypothetical protein